jgi:hypothetical protein
VSADRGARACAIHEDAALPCAYCATVHEALRAEVAESARGVQTSVRTRAQIAVTKAATKARREKYGEDRSPTFAPHARERAAVVVTRGDRYGRWTVLREAPRDSKGRRCVRVRCACGREAVRGLYDLRTRPSPGCLSKLCQQKARREKAKAAA